jgi:hypothetical protein
VLLAVLAELATPGLDSVLTISDLGLVVLFNNSDPDLTISLLLDAG